jgi:hypothetical protein
MLPVPLPRQVEEKEAMVDETVEVEDVVLGGADVALEEEVL